jgi:hypothetical protein
MVRFQELGIPLSSLSLPVFKINVKENEALFYHRKYC